MFRGAFENSGRLKRRLSAARRPSARWVCRPTKFRSRSDEVRRNDCSHVGRCSRGSASRRAVRPRGAMIQTRPRPWRSGSNPAAAASISRSSSSGQSLACDAVESLVGGTERGRQCREVGLLGDGVGANQHALRTDADRLLPGVPRRRRCCRASRWRIQSSSGQPPACLITGACRGPRGSRVGKATSVSQFSALARRTAAPPVPPTATVGPHATPSARLPRLFLAPPLSGPGDLTRHASDKIVAHATYNGNIPQLHAFPAAVGAGGADLRGARRRSPARVRRAAQDGVALPRGAAVPGFWDPRRRPERPDLSRIQSIRFLTDLDYPPFDYAGADGNPAGLQRRPSAAAVRRDQGYLHHSGAPLRLCCSTRSTTIRATR